LVIALCFGANLVKAPKIETISFDETSNSNITPKSVTFCNPDPHLIYPIPDVRSTAGSSKNIVFAEDGQNIGVIYSRFSGDPLNIFDVYWTYSSDRGNSWSHFGPFNAYHCRRTYPGLDAEQNWSQANSLIHFVWIQSVYDSSACYYANNLGGDVFRLPNSEDVIFPCVGVKDSFIIITGGGRIWRIVGGDTGRIFFPNAEPHFRFGSDGYMFFLWVGGDSSWPYYCESFDYGVTWTQPELIWQNSPPYPNMSRIMTWPYDFDCEVVRDTPIATVALRIDCLYTDSSELWIYCPNSGNRGNWHFSGKKLVSYDLLMNSHYPNVAADDSGNIFIGYVKDNLISPNDTGVDVGLFARPARQDTWFAWGPCSSNGNTIFEGFLEFAHNAPIIANGDSTIIGMIYNNAGNYPTTGNLYFDQFILPNPPIPPPGITEVRPTSLKRFEIIVTPSPFRNSVKFVTCYPISMIRFYDVTGKLVRELTTKNKPLTTELIWDGKKSDGSLAKLGVYFYKLSSEGLLANGKVILTR
jgi:hypothetical protein